MTAVGQMPIAIYSKNVVVLQTEIGPFGFSFDCSSNLFGLRPPSNRLNSPHAHCT
jgi:hypothetical protein